MRCVRVRESARTCRLNTYQLSLEQDDVLEGPWSCGSLAAGSNFLVPVSARLGGGVLVAAERSISHYRAATSAVQCTFDPVYFSCWAAVGADDARFLLGDQTGSLYLLLLSHNDAGDLVGLSRRSVGVTTTASAISYLDSGSCFVGSRNANSQLVKLLSEPVDAVKEPHNYIQARHAPCCCARIDRGVQGAPQRRGASAGDSGVHEPGPNRGL